MSIPDKTSPTPHLTPEERLAALSPEEKIRIGTALRFLVDLKTLHHEGLQIGTDLLEGKVPAADVAMRLMDLELGLCKASTDMLRRPLKVLHSEALKKGQTKLDDEPWLLRVRIKATEARTLREEQAREERFKPASAPAAPEEETEPDTGLRP